MATTRASARDKIVMVVFLAALFGGIGFAITHNLVVGRDGANALDAGMLYGELPPDMLQAEAEFRARVATKFPLLTPEDELVRTLESQGFKRDGWSTRRMTFRRLWSNRSLRCGFTASVTWDADDQGRVSKLDALFLWALGCVDQAW
jgi:hypothetical protein